MANAAIQFPQTGLKKKAPMILNDKEIIQLCAEGAVTPYHTESIRTVDGVNRISYGVSSFGYDMTLAEEAKIFTPYAGAIIDPKRLDPKALIDATLYTDEENGEKFFFLPPGGYMLGHTKEYLDVPRDVMIICLGKSTYARGTVLCNTTPIEPGFRGNVVIELANNTQLPVKIYANEGIAQFLFFRGNPPEVSYADRNGGQGGKYQGQTGVTLPRI